MTGCGIVGWCIVALAVLAFVTPLASAKPKKAPTPWVAPRDRAMGLGREVTKLTGLPVDEIYPGIDDTYSSTPAVRVGRGFWRYYIGIDDGVCGGPYYVNAYHKSPEVGRLRDACGKTLPDALRRIGLIGDTQR